MQIIEQMYNQFKLRITLDRDYKSLPKTFCCEGYFIEDTDICSICGNRTRAICPRCGGCGDVIGKIYPNSMTIPYNKCPICFGSGSVDIDNYFDE